MKDSQLKDKLRTLISRYQKDLDVNKESAFRDVLTDMRHIADDLGLDYGERDGAAYQVYSEERTQ